MGYTILRWKLLEKGKKSLKLPSDSSWNCQALRGNSGSWSNGVPLSDSWIWVTCLLDVLKKKELLWSTITSFLQDLPIIPRTSFRNPIMLLTSVSIFSCSFKALIHIPTERCIHNLNGGRRRKKNSQNDIYIL